jgi:hypothetical protein
MDIPVNILPANKHVIQGNEKVLHRGVLSQCTERVSCASEAILVSSNAILVVWNINLWNNRLQDHQCPQHTYKSQQSRLN